MKKLFTLSLLVLGSLQLFAQPANDDCLGIIDLGEAPICPVIDTFTNVDATLSVVFSNPSLNIPSCYLNGIIERDVWFQFTVPASGAVTDFTLTVTGIDGPNGSINQPQIAIYRGDCELDGMEELDCATSGAGSTELSIDLLGLTPGLTYFIRINDWSASASPNWGDFVLCLDEYDPVFNMGDVALTNSCAGTLFDSGGPSGDYSNSENLTFTICPDDFHQCIFLDLISFNLELGFDNLRFFAGPSTADPLINSFSGAGGGVQLQAFSDCVTVQFTSDGSFTEAGWELNWFCSPDTCTIPPPSTCAEPTDILGLPYIGTDLTTCNAGNSITSSPCNNDAWLGSEDYIFTYTSPGDECIAISITGATLGTGIGVFNDCPTSATDCLAQAGGGFGIADPSIGAVFLEDAGTYYIVVDNTNNCTDFNIEVQQVDCPVVFPSAAFCEDALSLNGCGELPAILSVAPGLGDPTFIVDGINEGCWGGYPPNFTFFSFQAQEDGNFGFTMESANPAEASDIDFQVWGPVFDPLELCDLAATTQPIRSSYAAGADPTGLADINPVTGAPVTDVCETAAGDDFVSTIDVLEGEWYVVLINDWGGQITSGAVSIDFGATTPGVLDAIGANFQVSADTALCPGQSAQLFASGGEVYQWYPATGLSCVNCQNPVATITETSVYNVVINTICESDTLQVEVGVLQVDAGPDQTVCIGEELQIIAGANFANVTYAWSGPAGFLSCTDCPDPMVTAISAGTFVFEVTVTGPTCSFSDEMTLTVLNGTAPSYEISDDQALCSGESTDLGGTGSAGVTYTWTSVPVGFTSASPNPNVTPSATTTYYLELSTAGCPVSSFDSVTVTVANLPILALAADTTICVGESLVLGSTVPEAGVAYSWAPPTGLDNPNIANPIATPNQTTQYTLTADRNGCVKTESVLVNVTQVSVDISNQDTIPICRGVQVSLSANAAPAGTAITWTPDDGSLNTTTGPNVIAAPQTATSYIAQVEVDGCVKLDTVYIGVDSLPYDLQIMPVDTQICEGELVLLTSPIYEPGDFGQIEFEWSPAAGQITPDSLYNMIVQPGQTTEYVRISTNGFCSDTTSALVTVVTVSSVTIDPPQPEFCQGESVQLTANSPIPVEFTWSPADGLSCTECPNPVASPGATTTYTVEADFDGCPVANAVTVVVVPPPSVVFPPGVICPGESLTLNLGPNGNWSYAWSSPDDPTFTSTQPAPVVNPTVPTTYEVTVDNGVCPPVTQSLLVQPFEPAVLTVSEDQTVCTGQSVTLTATTNVPGNFLWSPGGETGASITPNLTLGDNEFTVTFSSCGDTLTESVVVELVPGIVIDSVTISPADTVYEGTPSELMVFTTGNPVSYQWSSGGTTATTEVVPLLVPGETYSVTVTDDLGCTDVASQNVVVLPTLWDIPNVFTPNGDATNDRFQVIISGENVVVESFQVWNRWGQLVFDENAEGAALDGWDGKHKNEDAISDVYVYRIVIREPDGRVVTERGDVTLLR